MEGAANDGGGQGGRKSSHLRHADVLRLRVGLALFWAALGLFSPVTRSNAQTLPMPVLPPEPPPVPEAAPPPTVPEPGAPPPPEEVEAGAPRPARPWEYELGVGGGWDSNIDFLIPNGPGGAALFPRGGLARVFSGPRGQFRATAAGRFTSYPEQNLNRYYGDFGLDGDYRSSPSTSWRVNAFYDVGYSDSARILVEQGVLLPVVKTRSYSGVVGLTQKMGAETSLQVEGRYYRTEFDSPGLINGESVRGTMGLVRQLSPRSAAAIEYSVEYTRADQAGRSYLTHFGSLRWTRVLSPRSALLLEGGASYTPEAARAGLLQKETFFGGATFNRMVKGSSLTAFVRREVAPAFGIGVSRLEVRAGLSASVPMGRDWGLRMVASHVQPDTTQAAQGVDALSDDAFLALDRRLGRHLQLSGSARYRRRGTLGTIPTIEGFQAGIYLTLLSPAWREIAPGPGF